MINAISKPSGYNDLIMTKMYTNLVYGVEMENTKRLKM